MSDIAIAALLAGTILIGSMISVEIGLAVALIELVAAQGVPDLVRDSEQVSQVGCQRGTAHHSEHEPDVLGEREPQATPVAIADPDQDGDQDREIDKVYECRVSDRCRPT